MDISQQVISFELAKRLHELDFKADCELHWIESPHIMQYDEITQNHKCIETKKELLPGSCFREGTIYKFRAYLVGELCELLPKKLIIDKAYPVMWLEIEYTEIFAKGWQVSYKTDYHTGMDDCFLNPKLADALGTMLIHLIENKLL